MGVVHLKFTRRDLLQCTQKRTCFSNQTKTCDNYYTNLEDGDRTKLIVGKHIRSNYQPHPNALLEPIRKQKRKTKNVYQIK